MTEPLAAIYVRVSTEEQAKGFSLTTQRDACQALAAREGFAIPDQYIIADDVTGETLNRPGLKTLRTLVASKAVAAVLIYDLDRLSRRMAHQLLLEDEFESAGVQLLVVTDPLEAGPEGVLRRHVKGVLAEYEKAKILRRTGDGRIGRVKAGYPTIGAGVPLGYDYIRGSPDRTVRGSLVINVDEAEIVRRIFELCLQGLGTWAIARRLTAEGILTKRDRQRRSGKTQAAGVWSPSSVRQVLRNETYAGVLYYNKSERMIPEPQRRRNPLNLPDAKTTIRRRARTDWLSSPCPTIIDRETWERVQGQIRHNAAKNTRSRRSEYLLLAGRLRYGYCGMALVGYTDRRKNVRCYRCNSQQNHTQEVCRGSIRADVIEGRVWTIVELLLMEPATIEGLIARRQTRLSLSEKAWSRAWRGPRHTWLPLRRKPANGTGRMPPVRSAWSTSNACGMS